MKVSIQGELGSYHSIAAKHLFGDNIEFLKRGTFSEVFADVQEDHAERAVVAIENSTMGSINEVYDLLRAGGLQIVGEVYMRINHCLIGLPTATLKDIRQVYSQSFAVIQCQQYLDQLKNVDIHERADTAESVAYVADCGDVSLAAIGSTQAAKLHGLQILASEIENDKHNYTRFIVLSKQDTKPANRSKTSIVLSINHKPGALYKILGAFAERNINLSKLQSRPIVGKTWKYYFYLDFEAGTDSQSTRDALLELQDYTQELQVLGSYLKGKVLT